MRVRAPNASISIPELKKKIREHKEGGRRLIADLESLKSHYHKMLEYYEQWESDMNKIQNSINELSSKHNIPDTEFEEYDMVEDMLGGTG